MSTQHDGSGPYLRVEVTLAMAIVKSDGTILNDDMLDTTLAFGRPLADGPAIDGGRVTSDRSQQVIAQQLANLAEAVKVFVGQNFAFLEAIEDGRGMLDDVTETVGTREQVGVAAIRVIGGEGGRA